MHRHRLEPDVMGLDLTDTELVDAIRLAVRTEPDEWTPAALAEDLGVDSQRVQALLVGRLQGEVSLSSARRLRPRAVEAMGWRPTSLQVRTLAEVRRVSPHGMSSYDLARVTGVFPDVARRCLRDLWARQVLRPTGPLERRKFVLEADGLVMDALEERHDWMRTGELRDVLAKVDEVLLRIGLGVDVVDVHNHVLRRLHQRGAVHRLKDGAECVWRLP